MSVDTPGGEIGCGDRDPLLVGDPGFVEEDSPLPDRVDYDPDYDPARPIECERCGGQMFYVGGCKILCGNCGYRRDCSDP